MSEVAHENVWRSKQFTGLIFDGMFQPRYLKFKGIMKDSECMYPDCLNGGINLYFFLIITTFSFAI